MIVKVKFVEIIWDNYQGGSGKPVTRTILINLPADTFLKDIEILVIRTLHNKGIKGTFNTESTYPYDRLLKIEIVPLIDSII